ncbi:MAG: 3-methyl-2-oxobutanoate hydroxymethyltransferase [Candidatus Melainabacteria bacterium]
MIHTIKNSIYLKVQGKTDSSAKNIFEQARKLEEAGAIAIVLEMIPTDLASQITKSLKIPTIGIGAGPVCDGQILVSDDIFGMTEKKLSFVKRYAEIGQEMNRAAMDFAQEVDNSDPKAEVRTLKADLLRLGLHRPDAPTAK